MAARTTGTARAHPVRVQAVSARPARGPADTALPLLTNEYVRRLAPDRRGWNVTTLRGNQRLQHTDSGWTSTPIAAAAGTETLAQGQPPFGPTPAPLAGAELPSFRFQLGAHRRDGGLHRQPLDLHAIHFRRALGPAAARVYGTPSATICDSIASV